MSFQMPPDPAGPPRRPTAAAATRRRPRALLPTLVVVGALVALFALFTNFYTDFLWFSSIGFTQVFTTELITKIVLFLVAGIVMGGAVAANFIAAYRTRPPFAPMSPEQQNLERYRQSVEPFRRLIVVGGSAVLGLLAGSTVAGEWQTYLLWRNGTTFGQEDSQFGLDISFFTFDLPWYRFVIGYAFAVVVVSLFAAAATHYLYGGLRLQSPGERTSPGTRVHLSLLLGLFVLLKAVAYWLDRYSLATAEGRLGSTNDFVGLTFTDVSAVLPAKAILAGISVICALLFFTTMFRRGWLLPGVGVGLLLLCAIIIGSVYPAIIQRFSVRPSEQAKEAPYIAKNIEGTRDAYDIAETEVQDYTATTEVSAGQLREDADTVPGIRLLDPAIVSPAYQQLQQVRGYYGFPETLDVDRYMINDREQDAVVAVREVDLDGVPDAQRNWINDHTVYTHGFGFVAARGNTRDPDGRPSFFVSNIPPAGELGEFQPRIYFGEKSPTYAIVGAPEGTREQELDFPDDQSPTGQSNNTYAGEGGVPIGSFFRKALYAVKFQEANIVLSDLLNEESRILYERTPRERVENVAPWLRLDGNAYPAVVGERIVWILDGYTTSNSYPYSSRTSLEQATEDTLTRTSSAVVAQIDERVNYMRNSVKAVVDAYDGTVTLYEWDQQDPVLKTWMKAFPDTVTARSEISEEMLSHLRYPEDLFKVQRTLLSRYHVTDPQAFYSGQDFWRVPNDPTPAAAGGEVEQPPYYLTLQMPGQDEPAFSLTTSYVPRQRDNLAAFAAVNAEPGEDYGQIRLLVLPRSTTVKGPGQVQNEFSSDPDVATTINLLSRGDTRVLYGNLLTLPVGGGLLYVQPVYVRAAGDASYPLLQKVLVGFGEEIGFADTLQEALDHVFRGDAGAETPEPDVPADTPPDGETPGEQPPLDGQAPGAPPPGADALDRALRDMQAAIAAAEEALRNNDFAAYGAAQERLREALERAVAAQRGAGAAATPATPAPAGTPDPETATGG